MAQKDEPGPEYQSVMLEAEITARRGQAAQEHQQLDREQMGLEGERWQGVLETAGWFVTNCAATYRHADPRTRKLFNSAVIDRIEVRDGRITHVDYKAPFDLLVSGSGFKTPNCGGAEWI